MPTAVVIHLKALRDVVLEGFTGAAIHGLWFQRWQQLDPAFADLLHGGQAGERREFTLSPLMGLPRGPKQQLQILNGSQVWFRVTALSERLEEALETTWLPGLVGQTLAVGSPDLFEVQAISRTPAEHSWAGRQTYAELAEKYLYNMRPATRWRVELGTATTFKNGKMYFPFAPPNSLVQSWLERWQAFAPLSLENDLARIAYRSVSVAGYNLRSMDVREEGRCYPGCFGNMRLQAHHDLPACDRAALDLLAAYAFYCGSGHKTTQGQGMTRVL